MAWIKLFDDFSEIKARFPNKTPILIKVREQKLCLVFYEKDIFAFDNRCPHNGAELHRGKCNANMEIICPLHSYQFNLKSGSESLGRRYELNTYPVKTEKSALFIRLKD